MQCEGDRSAIHLVEPELALGLGDAAEPRKIVGETDDPPLVDRAPQDQLFRGERVQREKVERRDPGQREMVAIGHEVARKEERGVAIGDAHGLGPAGVALHAVEPHARKYFDGLIDELELARNLEGRVVVRQIAAAGSLIRGDRILPLATLEHVARAREGGDDPTVIAVGIPAGVVEVQVRVDDQRYLLGSHAEGLELIQQPRRILDPEYLLLPIGQLRAGAGLDDHRVVGVANEQAVHVHGHAIACVGGLLPLPEILRHDPEHRAAIEAEDAVAEDPNVETTNAHEASVWVAVEIRDLRRNDADALRALWRACGIRDRPGDDDASLAAMAARNPGLCIVGSEGDRIVASTLAGFDGRRGWLYHVATHPDVRRRGIATRLVRTIEDRLRAMGCRKLNLIVWEGEDDAMAFWTGIGYYREKTVEFAKELIAK